MKDVLEQLRKRVRAVEDERKAILAALQLGADGEQCWNDAVWRVDWRGASLPQDPGRSRRIRLRSCANRCIWCNKNN
jgi:hypothetical protein